jgi:diketogulonate reductase-like aldo/keto reductase
LEEPVIKELVGKYNKTPGQIILNWHLSRGYTTIPKTATLSRVQENFESATFELSPEEIQKISNLNKNARTNNHKTLAFFANIPLFD